MYTILFFDFPCSYEQYVLVFHPREKEKPGATQLKMGEYISGPRQTMFTILCKKFHVHLDFFRSYKQYVLVKITSYNVWSYLLQRTERLRAFPRMPSTAVTVDRMPDIQYLYITSYPVNEILGPAKPWVPGTTLNITGALGSGSSNYYK